MKLLWLILMAALPCQAAMTITRELIAPEQVAPGQPVRIAVTFWTDSWFNPPPEWPDFPVENGALLTTPLPNQLVTRREGATSWSGVRMERQASAWDRGTLRLPETEITLTSAGQPPVTVPLPALEKAIVWPEGVKQPDRFLPAASLSLSQKINIYYSGNDKTLRAGDVIERVVTVNATGILPAQIPPLLYAIPGTHTQRLTPENHLLTSGRGQVDGAQRIETLRYLPVEPGTVTLPPVRLRWWDTSHQQWQDADLPGSTWQIAASATAGAESTLKGAANNPPWRYLLMIAAFIASGVLMFLIRHFLKQAGRYFCAQWRRFWDPVSLPGKLPEKRSRL